MLVLMAEDEADLAELTIDYLAVEGIDCDYAADGHIAINLLKTNQYDAIVLDVNMPKADGFAVCQWLQQQKIATPVIFVTARDSIEDKLYGFDIGADDYLTKPFELDELVARLKVLGRRKQTEARIFELDNLNIDFNAHQVTRAGQVLKLKPAQLQLLFLLAQHSPNTLTRAEIEQTIWPNQDVTNDMFKSLVSRLRSALDGAEQSPLLHTIRGIGLALRKS